MSMYYRLAGYITILVLQLGNFAALDGIFKDQVEPDMVFFRDMTWQYFTVWTCNSQIVYAIFGIFCEILTLINGKEGQITSTCLSLREKIFRIIVWPNCTATIFIYWPVYFYDSDYWLPAMAKETIPTISNFISHGFGFFFVLWELRHLPRYLNTGHATCITSLTLILITYVLWIFHWHSVTGLWPYPGMNIIYGTIYFPIIILICYVITLKSYYSQYPMAELICGSKKKTT